MIQIPCSKKGFTLIELMVVIAIISILASFTAPSFKRQIAKANLVDVVLYASTVTGTADEYIMANADFPTAEALESLLDSQAPEDKVLSTSVTRIDKEQGFIIFILKDAIGIDEGATLTYSRNTQGVWQCQTSLATNVAPDNCQSSEV